MQRKVLLGSLLRESDQDKGKRGNLNSAMKRLVLGGQWVGKRLKAVRFALIALPGRVMRHARRLIIRLAHGHPSYELLLRARQRILALAAEPQRA